LWNGSFAPAGGEGILKENGDLNKPTRNTKVQESMWRPKGDTSRGPCVKELVKWPD